jgi:hypothetical protein
MTRSIVIVLAVLAASLAVTRAETYVVRPDGTGDFPTIQAAIDASEDGDVVELTDGTFTGDGNRNISLYGKAIAVRSRGDDPELCIIDCQGVPEETRRGFRFRDSGEGPETLLQGITIANGLAASGAGISIRGASPTIRNCILLRNHGFTDAGGGMACARCESLIEGCQFIENTGEFSSGIVVFSWSDVTLRDCTFVGNESSEEMGCIHIGNSSCTVSNCTFYGNNGGSCTIEVIHATVQIENTIVAFNVTNAVRCLDEADVTLSCCDIYDSPSTCIVDQLGVNGNITDDPLFCDPENGDFTLHENSPCAPFTPPNEECDLIGAWPVGCGPTAVQMGTWGAIKAMYRR